MGRAIDIRARLKLLGLVPAIPTIERRGLGRIDQQLGAGRVRSFAQVALVVFVLAFQKS